MLYTNKAIEHFMNPLNVGEIADADGFGQIGDEECGDLVRVWIKVLDSCLVDIKYKVFGCPAAIAVCSMMTELAMGKPVDEAANLTDEQVAEALGGLPEQKFHCSNLAASALQEAIADYHASNKKVDVENSLTILVENKSFCSSLLSEHGIAYWVEYQGKKVLFDTGQSDIVARNAEKIKVNLADTDAVILSHGHYDHTGGMSSVFQSAKKATLYLHPKAMEAKFSKKGNKTRMIGMSDATKEVVLNLKQKERVIWTEQPTEIFPGFFVTGPIPRITRYEDTGGNFFTDEHCRNSDGLIDDQSVYLKTSKGIVVLLGCAHSGVVNTLEYILQLTKEKSIYAVLGGMHLLNASTERVGFTIEFLKKYDVQQIGLGHCTGENAMGLLKKAFPERSFACLVGTQIKFYL